VTAADGAFSAVKTAVCTQFFNRNRMSWFKKVKSEAKPLNIRGLAFIVEF